MNNDTKENKDINTNKNNNIQEEKNINKNNEQDVKNEILNLKQEIQQLNKVIKEYEENIQKFNNELSEKNKKIEEQKQQILRNMAEFDNYKKKNKTIYNDGYQNGTEDIIKKILLIGDNLEIAQNMELDKKTVDGLKMLKKKYDDILLNANVKEINPINEKFDPNFAEAIMQVEDEALESGMIKQVLQKGYKINEKIIRYAKVSVIK